MKIYTVLSNHYDYYQFTDWIMTTASIDEVNSYLDDIKKRDDEIRVKIPHWEGIPVFLIEDKYDGAPPYDENCASREKQHIVVMVKEI